MCTPLEQSSTTSFSVGTFPEQLRFCFSSLSGSFKLGLFSNLSCSSKRFYGTFFSESPVHPFLSKNRAQNVNDLHGVGVIREEMWGITNLHNNNFQRCTSRKFKYVFQGNKLCSSNLFFYLSLTSVRFSAKFTVCVKYLNIDALDIPRQEKQYSANMICYPFRELQVRLFSINLRLRKHLYYLWFMNFRVVGNSAERVKYLHHLDVNGRTTVRNKERNYKAHKRRNRVSSRIIVRKIFKSMKKRTVRRRVKLSLGKYTPPSSRLRSIAAHYKIWYVTHHCRNDSFFSNFFLGGLKKFKMPSLRTSAIKLKNKKQIQNISFDQTFNPRCRILNSHLMCSSNRSNNYNIARALALCKSY